jgi:hypothetical protein
VLTHSNTMASADGAKSSDSDSESEKEEYIDSGLPPPCPYVRRKSDQEDSQIRPSMPRQFSSAKNLMVHLQLSEQDLDTSNRLPESANTAKTSTEGASEIDVFAERKKKLQSRVMTQSMPEIRDIRSLYNRGIGKSISHKAVAADAEAKSSRPHLDNGAFDSLFTDL